MAETSAGLQRLAPFVLGRARRGVVGSSRYAQRLRAAVLDLDRRAWFVVNMVLLMVSLSVRWLVAL